MTVTFFNTTTSESLEEFERQKNLQSKNSTNDHGPSFFEQPERYRKSEWPKNLNTMAGLPFAKGEQRNWIFIYNGTIFLYYFKMKLILKVKKIQISFLP